jgi:uncharacterized membrane protein YcaP (DUF421 family)
MTGLGHALVDGWEQPLNAIVKAVALFVTAALAFRFSQRRTIAEFTLFDWVTAVAVGAIIGRVATAADTSWLTGAAALLTLVTTHNLVSRLRFNDRFRRFVDPPVRVLIRNGTVDEGNLKRCRITHADLDAVLRQHGHDGPADVRLALFEARGSVSVFTEAPRGPRSTGGPR